MLEYRRANVPGARDSDFIDVVLCARHISTVFSPCECCSVIPSGRFGFRMDTGPVTGWGDEP